MEIEPINAFPLTSFPQKNHDRHMRYAADYYQYCYYYSLVMRKGGKQQSKNEKK